MGYLFLAISLFAGATKGFCGKKTEGGVSYYRDAVLLNAIRMALCVVIGFIIVAIQGIEAIAQVDTTTVLIALLSGAATAVFAVTWLLSVRSGAYMMVDIFLMLGVFIPIVGSLILYGETLGPRQIVGLCVLVVAVLIMCSYNRQVNKKITLLSMILLLVCGISSGMSDFSQKIFTRSETTSTVAVFQFYTYLFTFAILLIFYLVTPRKKGEDVKPFPLRKMSIYVLIMAICLFASSFFQTLAAGLIPAVVLYPLAKGVALILSAIMSAVFFHERITVRSIIGIATAFGALLLINL